MNTYEEVSRLARHGGASTAPARLVRGRLQLHGVTHDLDLEVEAASPAETTARAAYVVRGRLDRRLFGLRWNQDLDVGGLVLGDQVEISARVEMVRNEAPMSRLSP